MSVEPVNNSYHWKDLKVGMSESFKKTITQQDMDYFLGFTGDKSLMHIDKEFALSQGATDIVVYGALTGSLLSTLVGVYLPGKYNISQSYQMNFISPVYIDDELLIEGRVVEINENVGQIVIKANIYALRDKKIKVLRGRIETGLGGEDILK
jgi:acyl dehydratase